MSRFTRSNEGVRNSRYYWADIDTIAILVDAEPGAWGSGSGGDRTPERSKAFFGMSDVAHARGQETWGKAGRGEETFRLSQ